MLLLYPWLYAKLLYTNSATRSNQNTVRRFVPEATTIGGPLRKQFPSQGAYYYIKVQLTLFIHL